MAKYRIIGYVLVSLRPKLTLSTQDNRKFMIITFLIEHIYGNYS